MQDAILRSLIREALLTEEVYGAQAVVYHGTEANPEQLVSALLHDKFRPGEGAGSMYGKGLYTVYDLNGTRTERGDYGPNIIKLKLNLYGYIIFDTEVALKVYKAPLSIVEQAQEIGADEDIIEKLKSVKIARGPFSSDAAHFASAFLKGRVKGIVFTGSNDGQVAVVYDPTTVVPVAWKNVRDRIWTPVDRASIKPALRRSASGDWQEEKYETDPLKMLARLEKLPADQRIVKRNLELDLRITSLPAGLRVEGSLERGGESHIASLPPGLQVLGDLDMSGSLIESIPADLRVGGTLDLSDTSITSLPAGLQVGGSLNLYGTPITSLPDRLRVGNILNIARTRITSLPPDLQVGGLYLSGTPITSLPARLHVLSELDLSDTRITSLPDGLHVGGRLDLRGTRITSLPAGLQVGGSLNLHGAPITSLPAGLQAGGRIYGFKGDLSLVPPHLRSKIV
jgi:hypothetical protein